jgi:PQQ-like domain
MVLTRTRLIVLIAMAVALPAAACGRSPFENLNETLSAEIVTGDTTLLVGEQVTYLAIAQYRLGAGVPDAVVWTSSDTTVATVLLQGNGQTGFVTARGEGQAWLRAVINVDFPDSALITVVGPGAVRLRLTVPADGRLHAAVGTDSLVRLVSASGMLHTVGRGVTGSSALSCNGAFGPSLDLSNGPYVTGDECLVRHSAAGGPRWTLPLGDADVGVAVAADEAAVVLHSVEDAGGGTGAVVVSRVAPAGNEVWRDTLRAMPLAQRSAAAVASNGDIYVPWRSTADSGRLARISTAGTVRWDVALPAEPRFTSPAPLGTQVLVTYLGGVTAFDTAAGGVLWSRQFAQNNPGATDSTAPSSPVVDRSGRIFIQTTAGLHAYDATGMPLWMADSLGAAAQGQSAGVGAPAVLSDSTVVVVVGGSRVCGVRPGLGVPRWCGASVGPGDVVGGVVMGPDLMMWVVRSPGELVGLWNRIGAETQGWPTEGGNHQRTRHRQ